MMARQSTHILAIISSRTCKLKAHNLIYYIEVIRKIDSILDTHSHEARDYDCYLTTF